ncbi:hypothetical protein PENTCL1PPCAC_8234, partial [Pristionchus entomophagus]
SNRPINFFSRSCRSSFSLANLDWRFFVSLLPQNISFSFSLSLSFFFFFNDSSSFARVFSASSHFSFHSFRALSRSACKFFAASTSLAPSDELASAHSPSTPSDSSRSQSSQPWLLSRSLSSPSSPSPAPAQ